MQASIAVICPKFFDYPELIRDNLLSKNFRVFSFDERPSNNFFVKVLLRLGFRYILSSLINKYYNYILSVIIKNSIDRVLVINPETVPIWFLKKLRNRGIITTIYMWDSLRNKKYAKSLLSHVDMSFSFDFHDSQIEQRLSYLPLFYAKSLEPFSLQKKEANNKDIDILFVGTLHSDRYQFIDSIRTQANHIGMNAEIYLYCPNKYYFYIRRVFDAKFKNISKNDVSFVPLSSHHYTTLLTRAKTILDIQHPNQRGLTMRTIETFGANRKLITTNENICKFSLYNECNVLIVDRESPLLDFDFFSKCYIKPENKIYHEYSIDAWVDRILNLNN